MSSGDCLAPGTARASREIHWLHGDTARLREKIDSLVDVRDMLSPHVDTFGKKGAGLSIESARLEDTSASLTFTVHWRPLSVACEQNVFGRLSRLFVGLRSGSATLSFAGDSLRYEGYGLSLVSDGLSRISGRPRDVTASL